MSLGPQHHRWPFRSGGGRTKFEVTDSKSYGKIYAKQIYSIHTNNDFTTSVHGGKCNFVCAESGVMLHVCDSNMVL